MDVINGSLTNNELDNDWITQFENTDNLYKEIYKDKLYYTNIYSIYINVNNEIDKINNETLLLSKPNCITREEISRILKNNKLNKKHNKYSLSSILKYNISLDNDEIIPFLKCDVKDLEYYNKKFLTAITNIDAIFFENTIAMFHDLNDVFFLFNETPNKVKNTTKRHFSFNPSLTHKKTIKKYI